MSNDTSECTDCENEVSIGQLKNCEDCGSSLCIDCVKLHDCDEDGGADE